MTTINKDTVQGNWKQFKGKMQEAWGKLTDDDFDVAAGRKEQILGRIQERYGITKEEAGKKIEEFEKKYTDWKWTA